MNIRVIVEVLAVVVIIRDHYREKLFLILRLMPLEVVVLVLEAVQIIISV
jgi:hypothetical protein